MSIPRIKATRRQTAGRILLLALSALALGAGPGNAQARSWVYTDDFATDKALTDSYDHSPLDVYPGYALSGYLAYVPVDTDSGLGLFHGYLVCPPGQVPSPCEGHLAYDFPLSPETGGVQEGVVRFSYSTYPPESEYGHLYVLWSGDGETWTQLPDPEPGRRNEYAIVPEVPGGHLYLQFGGNAAAIDSLEVELTLVDPAGTPPGGNPATTGPALQCRLVNPVPDRFAELVYYLPTTGEAEVSIYDARGALVATPLRGEQQAGPHILRLDTTGFHCGAYYYRLVAESGRATGRILVVR